jgi:hypothetical protein
VLIHSVVYGETGAVVSWHGKKATDTDEVQAYLRGKVLDRLRDKEDASAFAADCTALSGTGMARDTLQKLLCAERAEREPWEIGEALAECILEEEGAIWPWNKERDKRTPQASLPGADLVGFAQQGGKTLLAIGEVKTSEDIATPPGVMHGRSGMIYQLESLAHDQSKHLCILRGLRVRCRNTDYLLLWKQVMQNYLESGGKEVVLFGVLLRDTEPHQLDIKNRADDLAAKIANPCRALLTVWYLPLGIANWPIIIRGTTS